MLRSAFRWAADLFSPRTCPGCDRPLPPGAPEEMCAACMAALPVLLEPWCERCGEPFAVSAEADAGRFAGRTCQRCRDAVPVFSVARAAYRFTGPVREAVHALKFRGRRGAAPVLGRLMAAALRDRAELLGGAGVVVPVPLHPARVRERGWNQAALIAGEAATDWGLPCMDAALVRTRMTPPQVGLDRPGRRANMAGAFGRGPHAGAMAGRIVVLVDDVLTTGSTVAAAAGAALAAGAVEVRVAAVARD